MQTTPQDALYYVHDPMCSWCYAFRPVWRTVQQALPSGLELRSVLGGLAPDSDEPMPPDMQRQIQATWRRIEQAAPGVRFNFDFWTRCAPRRSTYPACRAVVAARLMQAELESRMVEGVQNAYYRAARNPSDVDTLIDVAADIGLERATFRQMLESQAVEKAFQADLDLADRLGGHSFPSLILRRAGRISRIPHQYADAQAVRDAILQAVATP